MSQITGSSENSKLNERITEEYRVLHKVAQTLQSPGNVKEMLQKAMQAITEFEGLQVENKAGIFLADNERKVLRLFTTYGAFSQEFLDREKEIPFGDCLCGRVAVSEELVMSESCFTDPRHERTFTDMNAHGHYIVPLKSVDNFIGVMFLYTNTNPSWYQHSQEVLLSIGGLIADTIQRKQIDEELNQYRHSLEKLVESRTTELTRINQMLVDEIQNHKTTQERLRKLSNQIQAVREEEKSRISREVHDELGQSMTALKMDILHLGKKLPQELLDLQEQVGAMAEIVDNTITSIQRIAMELRPPILDAFGLCEAIAWEASEYEKRFDIKFDLNCLQKHVDLNKEFKTTLFRVFQEAVTNIARHAKASKVWVSLDHGHGALHFEIKDNGKGLNEDKLDDMHSLGLIGIRERIRALSGEVQFHGVPGKGTTVKVRIPILNK
ncbi:MAG: GAF domain-containing sensor histidine kinase [Nitrospinaceae bacterium]|nr:GAF domain-containing sensor histidine kinase [Nitrospinaceae bacterium]